MRYQLKLFPNDKLLNRCQSHQSRFKASGLSLRIGSVCHYQSMLLFDRSTVYLFEM